MIQKLSIAGMLLVASWSVMMATGNHWAGLATFTFGLAICMAVLE